jgi:hypothetical protein
MAPSGSVHGPPAASPAAHYEPCSPASPKSCSYDHLDGYFARSPPSGRAPDSEAAHGPTAAFAAALGQRFTKGPYTSTADFRPRRPLITPTTSACPTQTPAARTALETSIPLATNSKNSTHQGLPSKFGAALPPPLILGGPISGAGRTPSCPGLPASCSSASPFRAMSARELGAPGALDDTLVLDLRTHTAFISEAGRVRSSLSICVPTTLLRRANYGISRVAETLPSVDEKLRLIKFSHYRRIVALDADSVSCPVGSATASILAKFEREGYRGDLCWVVGGFRAVCSEAGATVEYGPVRDSPSPVGSESSQSSNGSSNQFSALSSDDTGRTSSLDSTVSAQQPPVIQCRALPLSAFQQSSTAVFSTEVNKPKLMLPTRTMSGLGTSKILDSGKSKTAANPFFNNIRQISEVRSTLPQPHSWSGEI